MEAEKTVIRIETDLPANEIGEAIKKLYGDKVVIRVLSEAPVVPAPVLAATHPPRYFTWLAEVCALLGWDRAKGADLVQDVNWFGCYDDGATPEIAVAEGKRTGVLVERDGAWFYEPQNMGVEEHKETQAAADAHSD